MDSLSQSIFSGGGWFEHLPYILLVLSMFSGKIYWWRVGVIASALAGIAFAVLVSGNVIATFWLTLLLAINLVMILRLVMAERGASFSGEEEEMVHAVFRELAPLEARQLIDKGFWLDHEAGQELIREGSAVEHLYYLSRGRAEVCSAGKVVGHCGPKDLIGEGTILTSDRASGTVTLSEDSRLWYIPAPILRKHLDKNRSVRAVLDRRIGDALKSKLRASNVALSKAGGVRN